MVSRRDCSFAMVVASAATSLISTRGMAVAPLLHLAPQDVLFVFHEVEPNLPRFPASHINT